MRWTVYVDMDAFYVSCELRERPELVGRPVIVGPDPKLGPTRGVVLSASYEARAYGVRSAMPVVQADRRCPDAVWIPADHPKYARISEEAVAFLRTRSPTVLPLSIDEAALEVEAATPAEASALARGLQTEIRTTLHLPSSLGVSPYRVVAKIASDRAKPGGVVVVPAEETRSFLAPLPVGVVPGIGPKTQERLRSIGVERVEQALTVSPVALRGVLGSMAGEVLALAEGTPRPNGSVEVGPRSRSSAETFVRDVAELPSLLEAVDRLATSLSESLEKESLRFRTVTVALRWADFRRAQRSQSVGGPRGGPAALRDAGRRLVQELWHAERAGPERRVRTVSLSAERLVAARRSEPRLDRFDTSAEGHD